MTDEFNLSKYRHEKGKSTPFGFWYAEEDIKEFINELKEATEHFDGWNLSDDAVEFRKIIDTLAGDKLK